MMNHSSQLEKTHAENTDDYRHRVLLYHHAIFDIGFDRATNTYERFSKQSSCIRTRYCDTFPRTRSLGQRSECLRLHVSQKHKRGNLWKVIEDQNSAAYERLAKIEPLNHQGKIRAASGMRIHHGPAPTCTYSSLASDVPCSVGAPESIPVHLLLNFYANFQRLAVSAPG